MVYSDINTNLKSVRTLVDVNISGKCDVKEHPIMLINSKQSSLIVPVKILPIVFRNFDRNVNPAINGSEPGLVKAESECSLVKGKRHIFFKDRLRAFIGFDRFKSLRSYSIGVYNELRRKIKLVSCFVITKMMKLVYVVNARSKAFISNVRDSFGVLLHSFKKQFVCFDFELDCHNAFHSNREAKFIFKPFSLTLPAIAGSFTEVL